MEVVEIKQRLQAPEGYEGAFYASYSAHIRAGLCPVRHPGDWPDRSLGLRQLSDFKDES